MTAEEKDRKEME